MGLDADRLRWFDGVYREHHAKVYRSCLRFAAGDEAWALDRMQDVFVKLAENIEELRDADDPGGWLYRVSVNTCCLALRRQGVWSRIAVGLKLTRPATAPSSEHAVRARRDLGALAEALGELPGKQRAVMVMVYLEEKSQKEVAAALGLSKGQISKLHKKALATLRAHDWDVDG